MQAVIQDRCGHPDVLRLGEVPEPVPADNEGSAASACGLLERLGP